MIPVEKKLSVGGNVQWTFLGEAQERDGRHYYQTARVLCLEDRSTRTFKVGECFYANEQEDEPDSFWVGQIVEMFDNSPDDDANAGEVEIVYDKQRMRLVIRWMYAPDDITHEAKRAMHSSFRSRCKHERFWSDEVSHLENVLEVIDGRALLFSSVDERKAYQLPKEHTPTDYYWPGDKLCVVRYFYGTASGSPPPLRELEKNELQFLLNNPTTDSLYKRSRVVRRSGYEPVMKGAGSRRAANGRQRKQSATVAAKSKGVQKPERTSRPRRNPPVSHNENDTEDKVVVNVADAKKSPTGKRNANTKNGSGTWTPKRGVRAARKSVGPKLSAQQRTAIPEITVSPEKTEEVPTEGRTEIVEAQGTIGNKANIVEDSKNVTVDASNRSPKRARKEFIEAEGGIVRADSTKRQEIVEPEGAVNDVLAEPDNVKRSQSDSKAMEVVEAEGRVNVGPTNAETREQAPLVENGDVNTIAAEAETGAIEAPDNFIHADIAESGSRTSPSSSMKLREIVEPEGTSNGVLAEQGVAKRSRLESEPMEIVEARGNVREGSTKTLTHVQAGSIENGRSNGEANGAQNKFSTRMNDVEMSPKRWEQGKEKDDAIALKTSESAGKKTATPSVTQKGSESEGDAMSEDESDLELSAESAAELLEAFEGMSEPFQRKCSDNLDELVGQIFRAVDGMGLNLGAMSEPQKAAVVEDIVRSTFPSS